MATGSVIYFSKQSKPASSRKPQKPTDKEKPKPKATVLDWIRDGYTFPGKVQP